MPYSTPGLIPAPIGYSDPYAGTPTFQLIQQGPDNNLPSDFVPLPNVNNTSPTPITPTAATAATTPAQDAAATQSAVQSYRTLSYLLRNQSGYDYGIGSKKRDTFYAGMGADMGLGLWALNRPTMGFDIWSAIAQGAQKGVTAYENDPNKPAGPSISALGISLPSVPGFSLPAWLTKPVTTVGGSIVSSVQSGQAADAAKAKAQAAAVGSAKTSASAVKPAASLISGVSLPMLAVGAALVIYGVRRARR